MNTFLTVSLDVAVYSKQNVIIAEIATRSDEGIKTFFCLHSFHSCFLIVIASVSVFSSLHKHLQHTPTGVECDLNKTKMPLVCLEENEAEVAAYVQVERC